MVLLVALTDINTALSVWTIVIFVLLVCCSFLALRRVYRP